MKSEDNFELERAAFKARVNFRKSWGNLNPVTRKSKKGTEYRRRDKWSKRDY